MNRIDYISSLTKEYKTIADVGCDHAWISINAVSKYGVEKAYALDINDGPLMNARMNIINNKLSSNIKTIKSDGLISLNEDVECIIIAGMGGDLICKILDDSLDKAKKAKALILSPNKEEAAIRSFLMDNGFKIDNEYILEDNNHIYEIIKASLGAMKLDDKDILYGPYLRKEKSAIFQKKYEKKLKIYSKSLEKCSDRNKESILAEINKIREIL